MKKDDFDRDTAKFDEYKNARDHLYNQRFSVASFLLKVDPEIDILKEVDIKGNNFLHHVCDNFLPYTIKMLLILAKVKHFTNSTQMSDQSDVQKVIKDLVTKENMSGISPIKKALKMVYSEKQIDTIRFLID